MWSHILREQLAVSADEFWDCVNDHQPPQRSQPPGRQPEAIPVGVVTALVNVFRISEDEVRSMTKAQAIERLAQGYTDQA